MPSEDDSYDAITVSLRGGAERDVDAGPLVLLFGTDAEMHVAGLDDKMMIRRSDVDVAGLERRAVLGMQRGQGAGPGEDFRQHTGTARIDMKYDKERRRNIRRYGAN